MRESSKVVALRSAGGAGFSSKSAAAPEGKTPEALTVNIQMEDSREASTASPHLCSLMESRPTQRPLNDDASVTLRAAVPEDEPFLFNVYASTRADEMAAWGLDAAQQEAFLRMQFRAQQATYGMQYEAADHRIIMRDHEPVGRILVNRTEEEFLLVDIALLAEYRNAGIGSQLVRDLQREAAQAGVPVNLHVLRSNVAAARLYERLGFKGVGGDSVYAQMRWLPDT
jgi:ribosomal protein S18 acetylase RimI-like enzyme